MTETGGLKAPPAPRRDRPAFALVALAATVSVVFVAFMLAATQGHFVPQVVDLYLVCQYAKAIVEGHPFRYNPGEPPSTGATSLLYTFGLALPHAIGIRGEGLIAFAIVAGAALYVASVLLARRVAARLGGPREGMLAGILVAVGGPVVWSFLYGSDIALFLFLGLWLFERWLASADAGVPLWTVPGVLLALARPEGLPIGLLLAAAWTLGTDRSTRRRDVRPWLPVAAGVAVLVAYRWLTGSWLGTSVEDKSLLASYGLNQGLAVATEYGVDLVRGLLLGLYPSQVPIGISRGWASLFFPPLALAFVAVTTIVPARPLRRATTAWLAVVALLFALVTPNVFLGAQFQRYVLWAFPGLLALAAAGLGQATTWAIRDPGRERAAFLSVAVVWVALAALSTLRFATFYGEIAGDVYRRDVAAAQWIRRNLPAGTPMANLATSVEYLTGHRNLNLHGVTTPDFFGDHAAEREADAFEGLRRLPPARRPPYLITTVSAQERYPIMKELVDGPSLYRSASFGDEIEIYRTRYDLLDRGREPSAAGTLGAVGTLAEVDRLNVCDSKEESAHEYSFASSTGAFRLWGTVRMDAYPGGEGPIADGGRAILGWESFRVAARPGRDLIIVARTAPAIDANLLQVGGPRRVGVEFPESALIVSVDGQIAFKDSFRPPPGWGERVLRITGNLVRNERPRLEIGGRYPAFQYWFFQ
jgi:hypothetical protein